MTNKFFFCISITKIIAITYFAALSCNKKFDDPPTSPLVDVTPNTSVKDLKSLHIAGSIDLINDNKIISGVVIADDKSGNFYKQLIIEDSTGGINISINAYDLYATYPVGCKIYIKAKGLYLGDYNGWIELGMKDSSGTKINGIATNLLPQYIEKGSLGNVVAPHIVSVSQLTTNLQDPLQSTLVQCSGFEFDSSDIGKTYADAIGQQTINFTLKDCSGNSILLRNSGYADFAGLNVPSGNGTITAIYAPYGNTKELFIRDTTDVQFYDKRCNGTVINNDTLTSIENIRNLYTGSAIKLSNYKIGGVIISDAAGNNISKGYMVMEDGSNKGISVYFGDSIPYQVGDSVILNITGATLTTYYHSLEIKMPSGSELPAPVATGKIITPQTITINQLTANLADYENTLIKIENATASGGSTFSGNKTLTDATGSITLHTATASGSNPGAVFAGNPLPSGAHTWIGYTKFYNTAKEFMIRNTNDVQ